MIHYYSLATVQYSNTRNKYNKHSGSARTHIPVLFILFISLVHDILAFLIAYDAITLAFYYLSCN